MGKTKSVKRSKHTTSPNIKCAKNKTLRHSKYMLTPIEYLKQSNKSIFGENILSNNIVSSVASVSVEQFRKNNINKLSATSVNLDAFGYNQLIQGLIDRDILNYDDDQDIIDAMLKTDRKYYCSEKNEVCYKDHPTKIPMEQTISAPHMHAQALKTLKDNLKPGANVLDVGSGSGILTVMFANMVNVRGMGLQPRGSVIGIDIAPEVVQFSVNHITDDTVNRDLMLTPNENHFKIITSNGKHGFPTKSTKQLYDVIHVGATNKKEYAPKYLKAQLNEGGIMFIPMEMPDGTQLIKIFQRLDGKIKYTNTDLQVRYGPFKFD
jgi:protein-L-isoaspartate(D-aspartate) O-methyltransferase